MVALGGGLFLMSEVPLYFCPQCWCTHRWHSAPALRNLAPPFRRPAPPSPLHPIDHLHPSPYPACQASRSFLMMSRAAVTAATIPTRGPQAWSCRDRCWLRVTQLATKLSPSSRVRVVETLTGKDTGDVKSSVHRKRPFDVK